MRISRIFLRLALAIVLALSSTLSFAHELPGLAAKSLKEYVVGGNIRREDLAEDIYKISQPAMPLELTDVKLRAAIQDVVAELRPQDADSAEVTVESLAFASELAALEDEPDAPTRIKAYFASPKILLFSRAAIAVGLATGAVVSLRHFGLNDVAIGLLIGAFWRPFQIGVIGEVWKALSSWILTPTTELIKVLNARYTAGAEQWINNQMDRIKPTLPGQTDPLGHVPNVATVAQDGMDFAGQAPDEQIRNYAKNRRMWIGVAKRYGQLNRDTHHHGRMLTLLPWADEQQVATLVEGLDTKLETYDREVEDILRFYRMREPERGDDFVRAFDALRANWSEFWRYPDWNGEELTQHVRSVDEEFQELANLGVNAHDLERLAAIREKRVKTVGTLITALTMNEVRSHMLAEANRNLEPEARRLQRVARRGLQLQSYVDKYRPLIASQQRAMGYENADKCQLALRGAPAEIIPLAPRAAE